MIIKGRSPTMRHVSRTHRVALDWLFDRINLDPKIQIKYIDTKNQLADMLIKGNFTRDDYGTLIATFRVARLTLQTPKLWWMSRPTVTLVTHACVSFLFFAVFYYCVYLHFCFFFKKKNQKQNIKKTSTKIRNSKTKKKHQRKRKKRKEASKVYLLRLLDGSKNDCFFFKKCYKKIMQQLRKNKLNPGP